MQEDSADEDEQRQPQGAEEVAARPAPEDEHGKASQEEQDAAEGLDGQELRPRRYGEPELTATIVVHDERLNQETKEHVDRREDHRGDQQAPDPDMGGIL